MGEDGETSCWFRRFQTDVYYQEPKELHFWNKNADLERTKFPNLVTIRLKWEKHYVILQMPVGQPGVAERPVGWQDQVEKARKEAISFVLMSKKKEVGGTHFVAVEKKEVVGLLRPCLLDELWRGNIKVCSSDVGNLTSAKGYKHRQLKQRLDPWCVQL
jgi:hypothetical protein